MSICVSTRYFRLTSGIFLLIVCVVLPLVGCSRSKARLRADQDAYCLLDQKAPYVGAEAGQYRIGVDRDSRMYDSNCPDCPPMPPDDPMSHRYMHCVDSKKGDKFYRNATRTDFVDPPEWRHLLPLNDKGKLVLDTEAAVRLGVKNDPDYQRELEELYLSALDVSFERFRFDTQLFGGSSIDYTASGRARSGSGESSSLLAVAPSASGNRLRLQRLTATGGELVVGLANSLVWQFAGPNNYAGNTLLDFSVVQPLLRGGGRLRTLESLTSSERLLLANVRSMERFRREYYLNVVVGRSIGLNAGAGATGAGAYLGLLQQQQELRNQRSNVLALQDSTQQLVASYEAGRIDRFQVELARQALFNAQSGLLNSEANYETRLDSFKINLGLPPDLEVVVEDPIIDQFSLLSPQLTELQDRTAELLETTRTANAAAEENNTEGQGDQPADENSEVSIEPAQYHSEVMPLVHLVAAEEGIEEEIGSEVQHSTTTPRKKTFSALVFKKPANKQPTLSPLTSEIDFETKAFENTTAEAAELFEIAKIAETETSTEEHATIGQEAIQNFELPPEVTPLEMLAEPLILAAVLETVENNEIKVQTAVAAPASADTIAEAKELLRLGEEQLAIIEKDLVRLEEVAPARREHLKMLSSRPEVSQAHIDTAIFDTERFDERLVAVAEDYEIVKEKHAKLVETLEADTVYSEEILTGISNYLLDLTILQARVRLDSIDLESVQLNATQAVEIASRYRRDWANARADLVDSWRFIHVTANDLESSLDLVFSGDIGNVGDNPLRLRDTNGRLRVGLEFDSPTSRLAERNVYRESIIQYQQARRGYYQFVDRVHQGLRSTLRQVRLNEINLELRREAVFVAVAQVDLVRLRLTEPPKPGETASFNNTTARDLVQALGDLLSAQNDLLSVWISNRVQSLQLELELGVMLVDNEGLRVDLDQPLDLFLTQTAKPNSPKLRMLPAVKENKLVSPIELAYAHMLEEPTSSTSQSVSHTEEVADTP